MKIAIVTETFLPAVDGIVTRLRHAVERFTSQGHEVLVLSPDFGVTDHAGAKVVGFPAVSLPMYPRPWALPSRKVQRVLREFSPDVVHAVQPLLLASSGAFAAQRLDLPLVASYHAHFSRYLELYPAWSWGRVPLWWHIRRNHAFAHVNLVTSQAMKDELATKNIPRLEVLRRGVDTDAFHPRFADPSMRDRLSGGAPHKTLLVYVGRLAREKDLQSLRAMMDRRDNVALALVGDGPYRPELEKLFAGTATTFPGFLRGEELASAFASADAFVFPSTSETLGLVIAEGMASGLPVLAARSAPTMEQVTDGIDGLLFDSGDESSLDRALDQLEDAHRMAGIREAARRNAEEYSWDHASDDLMRFYEMAMERWRADHGTR